MLTPHHFTAAAIKDPLTRALMAKMTFAHGGEQYDSKYPDGIPTSIQMTDEQGETFDSGLVMYPGGHARNDQGPDQIDLKDVLNHKFSVLGKLASDDPAALISRLSKLEKKSSSEVASLMNFPLVVNGTFDD
jgi:2-methylcitrate dehydratase